LSSKILLVSASRYTVSVWFIAILVIVMMLAFILLLICVVIRNRGAKYPGECFGNVNETWENLTRKTVSVSEKEKEQGREPMLKDERGFGEYSKP